MHKFLSSSSTSICLAVVALYLQICFALKLSPVHGTTSSSKGHKLDLMGEMKLLRSTFLHSFALVESEWDSIEWNNDNKGDIFASDRLGPLKYAMERWNTVEKRMYQKNGVDYSQVSVTRHPLTHGGDVSTNFRLFSPSYLPSTIQTRTYQEALRTAAAANAILGSAHWRRGDYHESAPLLREGCFSLWGSPFLDNQLQETHTWIECFGLLGEFYLSGKEDIETEEVRQLVVFVQTAFPWLVTSLLDRSDDTLGKEDVPVGSAEPNDVTQEEDVAIEGIAPIVVFKALLTLHRLTRPQGHALSVHITKAWTLINDTREQCHGVLSAFLPEHYDAWTPTTKNAAAEKATMRIREIHDSSSQLFSSLIETSSFSRVNKTSAAKQAQHVDMGEADSSKLAKERRVEGAPEKYMHDDDVDRITRKMLRGVAELLSTEIEHYVTVVTELVATVSTKSGLIATVQRGGYGAELTPNELETEELAEPFGVSSLNAIRRVMARTVREVFDLDAAAPSSSPVAGDNDASDDTRSRHRRASRRGAPSSSQQKRQEWSYFFGGQWLWWDIINAVLYSLLGIAGTVLVAGSDFVSPHMEISLRKWGARVLETEQGHDSSFLKKRSPRNGSAAAAIALKRGHKIALSASGNGKSPVSSSNPTSTTADLVVPVQEVAELGLVDKRNSYIAIMSHSCSAIATKLCTTARRGSLLCKAFSFVVLDSSTHFAKSVCDRTLVYLQSSFQRAAGTNRSEHVASELLRSLDGGVSVSSGSGNCGGGGGKIRAGRQALDSVHKRKGKRGARRRDGQACASSAVRPEAASAVPKGGAEDLQEEPDAVAATTTTAAAAAASDITSGENGGDGIDEATRTVLRELAAGNVAASGGLRSPSPHNGAYDQPEEDWITERGKRRKAHRDSAPLSNTHAVSAIDSPRERERSMRTANQAVNGRRERKNKKKSPSHRDLSANANSRPMSSSQLFSPSPEDEGEMDNFPPLNGCNVELTMPLNDAPARSRTRDEGLDDFSLGSESDDTTSQSNTSSSPKLSPQRLRSSWDGNVVRSRFASSTVIARSNTSSTSPSDASLATCSSRTTYASAISISDDYQDTRKHDEGLDARQLKSYPSHKRNRGVRHSAESGDMQEGRPQSQSYGVIQRKAKRYPQPRGTMVNDQKNRILHRPDDPDLDKNDAFSVHSVAESSLTGSDEGEVFTSYHNDDMGSSCSN